MGLRGPPREATELKLERGNPGKRRADPTQEPEFSPLKKEPPPGLPRAAKAEWVRLVDELINAGVLGVGDLEAFKQYCLLVAEVEEYVRLCKKHGPQISHEKGYKNYLLKCRAQLLLAASKLGLTPTTRNAVKKIKGKKHTEEGRSRFFGERQQGTA